MKLSFIFHAFLAKRHAIIIAIFVWFDGWQNHFVENGVPGYCMNKIAGDMLSGQQIEIDKSLAAGVYGRNLLIIFW